MNEVIRNKNGASSINPPQNQRSNKSLNKLPPASNLGSLERNPSEFSKFPEIGQDRLSILDILVEYQKAVRSGAFLVEALHRVPGTRYRHAIITLLSHRLSV